LKTSVRNNEVHACEVGIAILPKKAFAYRPCVSISGNKVYKSTSFGIYYQAVGTKLILEDNVLVDNQVGILAILLDKLGIKGGILGHVAHLDNEVVIRNSLVVGRSAVSDCLKVCTPVLSFLTTFSFSYTQGLFV